MKQNKIIYLITFLLSLSIILLLEASSLGLLAEDIKPNEKEEVEIKLLLSASNQDKVETAKFIEENDYVVNEIDKNEKVSAENIINENIQNQQGEINLENETEESDKSSSRENTESRKETIEKNDVTEKIKEPKKIIDKNEVQKKIIREQKTIEEQEIVQEKIKESREADIKNQKENKENMNEPPAWLKKLDEKSAEKNSKSKKVEKKNEKFDLKSFIDNLEAENKENELSANKTGESKEEITDSNQNLEKTRKETEKKIKKSKDKLISNEIENDSEIQAEKNKVYDLREKKFKGLKDPGIKNYTAPEYPDDLRKRNIEGRVILSLRIDKNGKSHEIEINNSSGYDSFDRAALEAVKAWKFKPAELKLDKVEVIVKIPIIFELN